MHKILVVDDEKDILETISELIEIKFNCEFDTAANGLDAFIKVQGVGMKDPNSKKDAR